MDIKEGEHVARVDFETRRRRYLTSCAILTNISTRYSDNQKQMQVSDIRETRRSQSLRAYQLDRLLDQLAALLVATGGGDCVAVALAGLTQHKLSMIVSWNKGRTGLASLYRPRPELNEPDNILHELAVKSGRDEAWGIEATVNFRGSQTRPEAVVKEHGQKIFEFIKRYHSERDVQLQRAIIGEFLEAQTIYSFMKVEARYKFFKRSFQQLQDLELKEYEFCQPVKDKDPYYIEGPASDCRQDEDSRAKRLRRMFLDLVGQVPYTELRGKHQWLRAYLEKHDPLPTQSLSREDLIAWHELIMWVFERVGVFINDAAKAAKATRAKASEAKALAEAGKLEECRKARDEHLQRREKFRELVRTNVSPWLIIIGGLAEASGIFRLWVSIFERILDGKGHKRKLPIGREAPLHPIPTRSPPRRKVRRETSSDFHREPTDETINQDIAAETRNTQGEAAEAVETAEVGAEAGLEPEGEAGVAEAEGVGIEGQPDVVQTTRHRIRDTTRRFKFFKKKPKDDQAALGTDQKENKLIRTLRKPFSFMSFTGRRGKLRGQGIEDLFTPQLAGGTSDHGNLGTHPLASRASGSGQEEGKEESRDPEIGQISTPPILQTEVDGEGHGEKIFEGQGSGGQIPAPESQLLPSEHDKGIEGEVDYYEEEEGGEEEEEDESDFDLTRHLTREEEEEEWWGWNQNPSLARKSRLFRRVHALAEFHFLVNTVVHNPNISKEIGHRGFSLEVIPATVSEGSSNFSEVENLEDSLTRFLAPSEEDSDEPVGKFISNISNLVPTKRRCDQLLDYRRESHTIPRTQHAELILLDHILKKGKGSTHSYIGVSKPPCLVCENVLVKYPKIRTRTGHGHVYISEVPEGISQEVKQEVFNVVETLAKRVTRKAYQNQLEAERSGEPSSSSQIKPMSGDSTFSHHESDPKRWGHLERTPPGE
ncbi:hypothetical protein TWF281_006906 [Arthrobotrys megalospora]